MPPATRSILERRKCSETSLHAGSASELFGAFGAGASTPPAQMLHTPSTEAIDFTSAFGGGPRVARFWIQSPVANAVKVAVYAGLRSVRSLPCKGRTGGLPDPCAAFTAS